MSTLIKKLLLASALVLGLSAAMPAVAQEEADGTEQVEPVPPEETAEPKTLRRARPGRGDQPDEAPEAPAPEQGTDENAE